MRVNAEISESGRRIDLRFAYNTYVLREVRRLPGAKFEIRGRYWSIPLDLTNARLLREVVGEHLRIGPELRRWGHAQVRKERNLLDLAMNDDAKLKRLPQVQPQLAEFFYPYQRADVAFLADRSAINGNQPGLGKTVEIIGATYEGGLEGGPHLVIAPKTSMEVVWQYEVERWTPHPVFLWSGDLRKGEREWMQAELAGHVDAGNPFWLVTGYHWVRAGLPVDCEWNTFTIDEYHQSGLKSVDSQFFAAAKAIKAQRKWLVSGTFMGGRPLNLYSGLHFLDPKTFSSKWRWAGQWLSQEISPAGYPEIGGIQPGREEAFYKMLAPYMVRRTKEEVLPQLPAKQHVDVWCRMSKKQRKQYDTFAAEAEIRIEEEQLRAASILAEYTRLKQFSNALCSVERRANDSLRVFPTYDSGKLPYLMERLEERGIVAGESAEGEEVAVVASQFRETAFMLHRYLNEQGIKAELIAGGVKASERARIVQEFQSGKGARVVVMVTAAGGVSITLDRADSVHIMDETWNPDDQEQLEDRIHRASRIHQVTVYTYRSKDTIEEDIYEVTTGKAITNKLVLDVHRQALKKRHRK